MNIYLATSWKNAHYERVLKLLRDNGHEVYDFREKGFLFSKIGYTPELADHEQTDLLNHEVAQGAYKMDKAALDWCDVLVMLYPCGNDAHVELGYAVGQGKYTIVFINPGYVIGLMDKMADLFVSSDQQLLQGLRS